MFIAVFLGEGSVEITLSLVCFLNLSGSAVRSEMLNTFSRFFFTWCNTHIKVNNLPLRPLACRFCFWATFRKTKSLQISANMRCFYHQFTVDLGRTIPESDLDFRAAAQWSGLNWWRWPQSTEDYVGKPVDFGEWKPVCFTWRDTVSAVHDLYCVKVMDSRSEWDLLASMLYYCFCISY